MSHHVETAIRNGVHHYHAGEVWDNPNLRPWGQHVILGFSADGKEVKLARPYAYASCVGSTGPTVLLGSEVYTLPLDALENWDYMGGGFRA